MREQWLTENQRLIAQDNFGFDLPSVEVLFDHYFSFASNYRLYLHIAFYRGLEIKVILEKGLSKKELHY